MLDIMISVPDDDIITSCRKYTKLTDDVNYDKINLEVNHLLKKIILETSKLIFHYKHLVEVSYNISNQTKYSKNTVELDREISYLTAQAIYLNSEVNLIQSNLDMLDVKKLIFSFIFLI